MNRVNRNRIKRMMNAQLMNINAAKAIGDVGKN